LVFHFSLLGKMIIQLLEWFLW